jgi:thiol-disulfide isomerase/thioredoxin
MARVLTCATLAVIAMGCRSRSDPGTQSAPAPAIAVVAVDPPAAPGSMAPFLTASGDAVIASWLEPAAGDAHRLRVARWQRGAWSAPVTVTEDARIVANWADVPVVARGGDGALIITWAERVGDGGEAYDAVVARSTDDGTTWRRLGPLHADRTPAEHGFVSMVADDRGVRAFWLDGRDAERDGGATALRTARVGDAVTDEAVVDDRVCDCCATAAAATDDGPRVAFRDRSDREIRDIRVARPQDRAWSASTPADDGWQIAGCPVNGPALAARGRDLIVAWYTYANSTPRVRAAFSRDGGATFGPAIEIDAPAGARAPLGRVGVVLDDDGTALVSWMTSARERASVRVRRVAPDGRAGEPVTIAATSATRDAGFARMVRVGDDVLIAWTEPGAPSRIHAARVARAAIPSAATTGAATATASAVRPGAGTVAPAITAIAADGSAVALASLRGKVVLLNLWATWCEPCRAELPELTEVARRHADRGLTVIGLDVDRGKPRDEIAAFAARRGVTFPIWIDEQDRAATALGATTFPVNVLIDREGVIRWRRDGAIRPDDAELRAALEAALAAPP